ncbi:PH domain-containing protein [Streptomyces sp. NPDC006739]|uniref:PH domain-containing protein n=1 Tax=Streptomyces sp. NPDC006739 TaxID=3364763 RepID=UPI00367374C4
MDDGAGAGGLLREYRRERGWPRRSVVLMVVIVGNAVLQTVRTHDDMPFWWAPVVVGSVLVVGVRRGLYEWRARTWVTTGGISRRGAVRSRAWAWSDIYDVRVEENPVSDPFNGAPRRPAFLYDREGRRFLLPHLDEWQLPDPCAEVAALRGAARQHGMAAERRPEVEERILRRAGRRKGWQWAGVGAALVLGAMIVATVAEAALGAPAHLFLLLLVVPLAAFGVLGALLSRYWAARALRLPPR